MKLALIIVGAIVVVLVILVVVVLVIGSRLPQHHIASRSIRLDRSANDVYATVRDFEASPKWRPNVRRVEMLGAVNGHLQFRKTGSNGTVTYELVEDVPNERMVTRIVDRDLGYSGSWAFRFDPSDRGTLITITESGDISNPVFKFMARYIFGLTASIDAYLKALAKHFGESAMPQNAEHPTG